MSELAASLQTEAAAARWQAIETLNSNSGTGAFDAATLSILTKALADDHPFVRWQAGLALTGQADGRQRLTEILNRPPEQDGNQPIKGELMRAAAADALGTYLVRSVPAAKKSPQIKTDLINALHTGDTPLVRQSLAEALAAAASGGDGNRGEFSEVVSYLIRMIHQEADPWVRRAAVYALGHIKDQQAVGALVQSLQDRAVIVRRSAAYALGALRALEAIPSLKNSLADRDPLVRRNAVWALGRIGRREALGPELLRLLDDSALDGTVADMTRQTIKALRWPNWLRILPGWDSKL